MLRSLETERVVLIRCRRRLVAWALIQCANPNAPPNAYFFVSPDHRRQGLGTFLLNEVLDRWVDAEVHPWDDRSFGFFSAQARSLKFHPQARHFVKRQQVRSSKL
jgi:GNAT superfamily N-acetyltransferase